MKKSEKKRLEAVMATHNRLKAQATRWKDMTAEEQSEVRRLSPNWLMSTITNDSLVGRNNKGEFCNYGE